MIRAHAARRPGHVRMAHPILVIASWCVVADVYGVVPAERTFAVGAMVNPTADEMRRGPHNLSIMTDPVEIL